MARKEEPKIQANNELEKKIMEAFEVFDHSGKQVVDVREIGTILRSLGCCPTEAEVQEVILATENKEATGNVPLVTFLPYMCKVMIEHRFYPASAEMLLAAFKYFDKEGRGHLTKERFTQLMLEEGEPFTQEEFDEMMQTALDPVTDTITYEYYINQLMDKSVYLCAAPTGGSRTVGGLQLLCGRLAGGLRFATDDLDRDGNVTAKITGLVEEEAVETTEPPK